MDEKREENISYFVHEGEMARMERHVKRLFIMWIITFAALILTNIGWIHYENQFQDVVTVSQDAPNGNNNYVGRDGDITNGTPNNNEAAN